MNSLAAPSTLLLTLAHFRRPALPHAVWRTSNLTAGNLPYAMDYGYSYDCECQ